MPRVTFVSVALAIALVATLSAQNGRERAARQRNDACNGGWRAYCEVREDTFISQGFLDIDSTPNGGITIHGSDRADVRLRTQIQVNVDDEAQARAIADQVRISNNGGQIRAEGPADSHWSASFELEVPRNTRLQLTAKNGGIALDDVSGEARLETTNGGIALSNVGGDIRGTTKNGGISVKLSDRWNGTGLDLETKNGGVTMSLPQAFNAQLDVSTVNGGLSVDFPVPQLVDNGRRERRIVTTLGAGGPMIKVATVNGGVRVNRR